ncbi:MAG: aromatic ring-hydroxylating dioxygenase subunit alpha [Hyphomicrobiales bacterium]|nr:aromatic ring-hydroxylating dioxygenase subunit alpha [Hyphomicrobiales bacterium]
MSAGNGSVKQRPVQSLVEGQFIRNAWYMAGWTTELDGGTFITRKIIGEPLVIFRTRDGSVTALEDRCPHRWAPLSLGTVLDNGNIQCTYHGLEYDRSGMCVNNPHRGGSIPPTAKIASYPAVEKYHCVWVWMGDKQADESKIPDFSVIDKPGPFEDTAFDMITIDANYKLIVDNLLDLSHVAYLHAGTLGNAGSTTAEITVKEDGDDLLVSRLASGVEAVAMHAMQWPGHPDKVDHFQEIRWMAPSCLNLYVGLTEIGKPWDQGTGIWATHMLTPETEHSTFYFFTAVRFGLREMSEEQHREIQHKIGVMRRYAFEVEDGPMIEAQQRVLDAAPRNLDPSNLNVDLGTVRFRRAISRMEAAEQTPA